MDEASWILIAAAAAVFAVVGAFAWRRRRREQRDRATFAAARAQDLHLPASLHPEIDPARCIGSLSCIKACPEGDILGVVDGAARLIRGANCIGHGRCALECPVGAIRLVFGTSERGLDLPEVDASFESARSGVHVVGELGGMGLIRNAVTQGLEVAETLAKRLQGTASAGVVDVAIVGAGPAGLAAALGCRQAGLSLRVLEQESVGGAVAHYPRHKIAMTAPLQLPYVGRVFGKTVPKEDLLALWAKATAKADLRIEEGVRVTGLEGGDGDFTLQTDRGATVRARKVVLATGRRGTPRKLGVPGEEAEKVAYRLVDPVQYAGAKVLVVGGGDSALEAAIALAEETDAEVTLSYRNPAFGKCREANRQRFEALVAQGRVGALMGSQVGEIRAREVALTTAGGPVNLANDYVLVLIGGELPLEFLKKLGVAVKRFHGDAPKRAAGPGARETRAAAEERRRRRLAFGLAALGILVVALLAQRGWDYYLLSGGQRLRAPGHATLKPAGPWGHGVGLVATAFMLSNFLYALRKRVGLLKGHTTIRTWLTFHMFVGFMSPLVILFHAAFQANNLVASATLAALAVVVGTGVIGRFVYGLVPTEGGAALGEADVLAELERSKGQIESTLAATGRPEAARALLAELGEAPPSSFLGALARLLGLRLRLARHLRPLRAAVGAAGRFDELQRAAGRLARLRVQASFLRGFKRLLAGWRLFHAGLAALLVLLIAAHIGLSIYLGYTWILR